MREIVPETGRASTLVLDVPDWPGHRAGQHVDVRLTADDGYQAERSYSISAAPGAGPSITVEELDDGEVSPYLVRDLQVGDVLELRGPLGGWFVWTPDMDGPLLLIAGGSGIAPLMAMLRHHGATGRPSPARMLLSAKDPDAVIFARELQTLDAAITYTRRSPPGWTGFARRVDAEMLAEVGWPPERRPRVYVCGPTAFVEAVATDLVALGHDPDRIRTERFGATGG